MKRLVLVGGGHAHVTVLKSLARERPAGVEAVLVTPSRFQIYSGMLPGWMAGHYVREQCQIDLQRLADSAQVRMVTDRIVAIVADQHSVRLPNGQHIEYDLLSLDVGSDIDVLSLQMVREKLLPVRPLDEFFEAWPRILSVARSKAGYRLAIVGGGAAGVELALAARYAFTQSGGDGRVKLVVSDAGLLMGHGASAKRRIARMLASAGVLVHHAQGVGAQAGVLLADGTLPGADWVIAATGARAPRWISHSGLKLDENEYVAVDANFRSSSHRDVFAAGDVAARQDIAVARSGVHAVHSGPVLAANLLAELKGGAMRTYRPRRRSLYLLACGPRYAVASWGRWSAEGAWVWRWKDWIDRRFVKSFEV